MSNLYFSLLSGNICFVAGILMLESHNNKLLLKNHFVGWVKEEIQ